MAWNLWTSIFGMKRGKAFEPAGDAILSAALPQAAQAVDTINTIAASIPAGTPTVATVVTAVEHLDPALVARLETAEKATLAAVNKILTAAGVDPIVEKDLDAAITAEYQALEAGNI